MIKSYIATRVFVMVDVVMGVLFLVGLIIGFHVLLAYAAAVTIIWCTIVIPLAWLGVWSVGHRLNLVHRKHSHEQYIMQQRDLMQLEVERHNVALPYPNMVVSVEKGIIAGQVSQPSTSGVPLPSDVPLSQSVPQKTGTPNGCNVTVAYYLSHYPHASIREVERATGIPKSNIGRTPAWKNRPR